MAVIWRKKHEGSIYEVRAAGRSRRLYTNGVFHTQYNPARVVTGGIWDLLMIPAFFKPLEEIKRVLVMGVGGGAVIRQLNRFTSPDSIIGIELNPIHLYVAKKYFGVGNSEAELIEADAVAWLKEYSGPPFDLIIDDLFTEEEGEPVRAVAADSDWLKLITDNLNKNGMLVMNFISSETLKSCALFNKTKNPFYHAAFQISMPIYDNAIGIFLGFDATSTDLRMNLKSQPRLGASLNNNNLNYTIRRLF
ncbi:hypothetical protein MNBD_GAMMA25-1162 [hydrothermal vent metagenome]|uniref:Spermidine synthase n=1 Tax=hydrothermal vent metagenome TaxID=652676 RepID=A0A3B1AW12_9ZZZZ